MDIKLTVIEIKKLEARVLQEALQKDEVKISEEYQALGRIVETAKNEQLAMLEGIKDSSLELEGKKNELFDFMIQTNVQEQDGASISYKIRRSVNVDRAKEVMGQDNLMAYVKVTQKDLKDFSEQFKESDPEYCKEVLGCIEVTSKEPSTVKIS